jgi:PIN domain nuclease of toxin-antitoxin system
MRYLIDTHILIWHTEGNRQLKSSFIRELANPQNQIFVSKVSLWEIAIKASLGKLQMTVSFPDLQKFLLANNFQILDYNFDTLKTVMSLPFYHNDPFDRLLISQSIAENLILLTDDSKFEAYKSEGLVLG